VQADMKAQTAIPPRADVAFHPDLVAGMLALPALAADAGDVLAGLGPP
jgi:hypothetical protein